MYHYSNQMVYSDFQHCRFYGARTIAPDANVNNVQINQPGTDSTHAAASSQVPHGPDLPESKDKAAKAKAVKAKSVAGKEAVDTSNFTVEQRAVAAVWVHERLHTSASMGQIKQHFEQRFGRPPPAKNTLLMWERKLFATGSVHDAPRPGRPARRKLLVGEVHASLRSAPALSVRARAAALHVPRSTLRALLRRDMPLEGAEAQPGARPAKKKKAKRPRRPPVLPPAPPEAPPPEGYT